MVTDSRRKFLGLSLPILFSAGCLGAFGRDDTVEVSNETDETHAVTVRFVHETTDNIVSKREMTLKPGAEEQYEVHLSDAGDESSHYVVTATTESGLEETHDLGEGVLYTMDVTVASEGLDISHTIR